MDRNKKITISEPDENGVRYYGTRQPGRQQTDPQEQKEETSASDVPALSEKEMPKTLATEETAGAQEGPGGPQGPEGPGGPVSFDGGGQGRKWKRFKMPIIICGGILLVLILLAVACEPATSGDHISVLYINGTISSEEEDVFSTSTYNHKWVMDRLDEIINDPSNMGLILFVNTPGGGVYETDEIYLKLKEYKETGRPLYSAMGSMAASGGYYLSAPADKIIANRNCWTGSIGVTIGTLYDVSELLDKYGIKSVTITSGKNKAMGSSVEPLTDEQRAIFQSLVDEAYDQFVGIVAEGRNMPKDQVKKLADGRIYTAKQALSNGLVDQIGTLDEAVADMRTQYGLYDCSVESLKYKSSNVFKSILGELSEMTKSSSESDVTALLELMNERKEVPISYTMW